MNGISSIFMVSGLLCLFGLAEKQPVRGGIDVAWGVELHESELYGPVIARAYELESEVAQYPRIVVGPRVVTLLQAYINNREDDDFSRINRSFATLCLGMLTQDDDGFWLIHYLGDTFRQSITQTNHRFIYDKARAFVLEQLEQHRNSGNSKLSLRYSHLLAYFDAFSPPPEESSEA